MRLVVNCGVIKIEWFKLVKQYGGFFNEWWIKINSLEINLISFIESEINSM